MTDSHAALMLDRALDGEHGLELNGSQPLLDTAEAVQALYDQQKGIPSQEFVLDLERLLVSSEIVAAVSMPAPPLSVTLVTHPNSGVGRGRHRVSHVLAAIAAALLLLLGGAGAIVFDGLGLGDDSEPSAIPAIGMGTVEAAAVNKGTASPTIAWTIPAPDDTTGVGLFASDGETTLWRVRYVANGYPFLEAIDLRDGTALWKVQLEGWAAWLDVTDTSVLVALGIEAPSEVTNELVSFDRATGEKLWQTDVGSFAIDYLSAGDRVFALAANNQIRVFKGDDETPDWTIDLTPYLSDSSSRLPQLVYREVRMALRDGVLAVVTDRGDVIGVDAETGQHKWTVPAQIAGPSQIAVVGDAFVVLNSGQGGQSALTAVDIDRGVANESDIDVCQLAFATPRSSEATPEIEYEGKPDLLAISPETGHVRWRIATPVRPLVWQLDDESLVGFASVGEVGDAVGSSTVCRIDGSTGTVTAFKGSDISQAASFAVETNGELRPVIILANGAVIMPAEADLELLQTLPELDVDERSHDGIQWAAATSDAIYVALADGTLIKMLV